MTPPNIHSSRLDATGKTYLMLILQYFSHVVLGDEKPRKSIDLLDQKTGSTKIKKMVEDFTDQASFLSQDEKETYR